MGLGCATTKRRFNNKVKAIAEARLGDAYRITEKQARYEQIDAIKADVIAQITAEDEEISEGKS